MEKGFGGKGSRRSDAPVEAVDAGRRALLVRGVVQSVHPDDAATGYWSRMLPGSAPGSALLLGMGGGTVARLIERTFGPTAITGVDESAAMLSASAAFGAPPGRTRIVEGDAFVFLRADAARYGFIAVDLYRAERFDRGVLALPFLRALCDHLQPGGTAAFNLMEDRALARSLARIERVFERLRLSAAGGNVVFHGRPRPHARPCGKRPSYCP